VIETAKAVTGRPIPVKEGPRRAGDPPVLVANADAVRRELGWQPKYAELRAIVETAWNWHKNHADGYPE
jgi:UDP-glucose 4-epimerase